MYSSIFNAPPGGVTSGMSEMKRKKGESFESFMRRAKRGWQQSGKILQAKKVKYYTPPKSRNVRRKQAVAYAQSQAKEAYLRKIGKLPQEEENAFQPKR